MDVKTLGIVALIIGIIIGGIILFFVLKPYFMKHDTTFTFVGGLGSGKTLEMSKTGVVLIRKQRLVKYYLYNFNNKWINGIRKLKNKLRTKKLAKLESQGKYDLAMEYTKRKPLLEMRKDRKKPLVYSNYPIHFRTHLLGTKKEWSTQLQPEHLLLLKEINEYSVVLIDELPQFVSQFDWDIELVQTNMNEFITYFRHYIGGYLGITAQSVDEIECHIRRKLNQAIWCFDMHVLPFKWCPIFYYNRMCDYQLSDQVSTISTTYIEDNTKLHFGLMPRKLYDTRCYRPRYEKVNTKVIETKKWRQLTTKEVLRLREYVSPLDTKTTPQQIKTMEREIAKLERNNDNEN